MHQLQWGVTICLHNSIAEAVYLHPLLLLIMTSLAKSISEQQRGWKLPSERLYPDTNLRISLSVPGTVSAGHLEPQPSEPQT